MIAPTRDAKKWINNHAKKATGRVLLFSLILGLTGFLYTTKLDAEIYKWVDENDVKTYTNKSPANDKKAKILFDEYPHDEVAHLIRLKTDREIIDSLIVETKKEEQLVRLDEQKKLKEEQARLEAQERLEKERENQPPVSASLCFSPSYSIQQGRTIYEKIVPTYIGESEYLDLEKLFQGLEGEWSGDGWVLFCTQTDGQVYEELDNYSINSIGKIHRGTGEFSIESALHNRDRWTKEDKILRLYLSEKILAEKANLAVPDIELISVSSDELVYVNKRKNRRVSGPRRFLERVNTIKKTSETSFLLERIVYLGGMLRSISSWHLERR
jgi:hypothetical protein